MSDHNCFDHLSYHDTAYTELQDGLYETWHDEWWICSKCGERYDAEDAERILLHQSERESDAHNVVPDDTGLIDRDEDEL